MASGALITDYIKYGSGAPSGAPSVVSGEYGLYQDTATGNIYYWNLSGTPAWTLLASGSGGSDIRRAEMWHQDSTVTAGNALTTNVDTNQPYSTISFQSTAANADAFTNGFYVAAGTYTLSLLGLTYLDKGMIDWTIDGTSIATGQDWYSSGLTYKVIKTITSLVLTAGWHKLKGTVNGKNASSSGYSITLTRMWLKQAAD